MAVHFANLTLTCTPDLRPASIPFCALKINAIAPLRCVETLLPSLGDGANGSGGFYGYRMSKAALNAAGVSLARDLKPRGIAVAILHPGMVATDMTARFGGGIPPADSAKGLLARVDELNLDNTGTFWHMNGEVLPW